MPFLKPLRLYGPLRKPVRGGFSYPLPRPEVLGQSPQLPRRHRPGDNQPPKRPAPAPKQPVIKRMPAGPLGACPPVTTLPVPRKQPVTDPGDLPPAPKPPNKPSKLSSRKRRPPRPGRQRKHHFRRLVIHAANQRIPGSDNPHRSASGEPHPPKRDRTSITSGNPRVIRRHEGGETLSATGIRHPPLRPTVEVRVLTARNLTDRVSRQATKCHLKAEKTKPAACHHETSQPCPRQRV